MNSDNSTSRKRPGLRDLLCKPPRAKERKTNAEFCREHREKLKQDADKLALVKAQGKERAQRFHSKPISDEEKARRKELARQASKRYRDSRKRQAQADTTYRPRVTSTHKTRKPVDQQREKWRLAKRSQRENWGPERRSQHREESLLYYHLKKEVMSDEETGSSSAASQHRVNIFDDHISYEAAFKIIKSSQNDEDEDDEDGEINFDGTPVRKRSSSSRTTAPDISSLAVPATSLANRTALDTFYDVRAVPVISPAARAGSHTHSSYGHATNAITYGHSRSQSFTMGSSAHPDKSPISSSSSLHNIEEVSGAPPKAMTVLERDKLEEEIRNLTKAMNRAKRDRWVKPPVDDTLRSIMLGKEHSLEMYKSLEDKLQVLDKALQLHDGNAIITVILFLQRSLSKTLFNREIIRRPSAANHYLSYLKTHYDYGEYLNLLIMLGRKEEAAIFKFKLALPSSDVVTKISKLKDALRSQFQADSSLATDSSLVQEYVDLLERQRPIEESDSHLESAGKTPIFIEVPRRSSLIGMSVVTSLYYCCLYHYNLSENSLASPNAIRKRHGISEKQFIWTAVSARAKLRQWKDIETLLTTKGWFGGTKMKSVIGFDKILAILHRNNAPPDVLEKYLALLDNLELRLTLAKKVSCHRGVVDALVAGKNRAELERYASTLERYSKEGLYAYDVLNSSAIQWK